MPADIGLFAAVYLAAGRGRSQVSVSTPNRRARTVALLVGATAVGFALGLVSLMVVALLMGPLDVFDGWWAHPLELAQVVAVPVVMATIASPRHGGGPIRPWQRWSWSCCCSHR
jgi:hypothetical protein